MKPGVSPSENGNGGVTGVADPALAKRLTRIFEEANHRKAEIDREAAAKALAVIAAERGQVPQAEPKWISLDQAAPIRRVTRETMARHAEQYGLGTFTNRRWRIDENRLRALNDGRPYEPLNPHPDKAMPDSAA